MPRQSTAEVYSQLLEQSSLFTHLTIVIFSDEEITLTELGVSMETQLSLQLRLQTTTHNFILPSRRPIHLPNLLLFNPVSEEFLRTISVKFYTEVTGWLRYKMAKKYCRKFQPPVTRTNTNVTDDRLICDSRDPNVTQSG